MEDDNHSQEPGNAEPLAQPTADALSPHKHSHKHSHKHHHPHHRQRLFDYGELRLLVLLMLEERPRHGYELIKSIEERLRGRYVPSPGVIYPTLSWLDDMGYATLQSQDGTRKSYQITTEGRAFLAANRTALAELLRRTEVEGEKAHAPLPDVLDSALHAFKHAIKHRIARGGIDQATAATIAHALMVAQRVVDNS